MAALSLLEKLAILIEVSKSSILFIIAFIVILVLGLILITTNKMNVKSSRKLFVLLYIFIIAFTFMLYKESLKSMCEYLMNNLFVLIYFPNLAAYFAAIVITSVILWYSVFSFKTHTFIKNVNIVVYLIMSYLLVVLLSIINNQKLDVFDQVSIYSNKSAQAIIELSSALFIVWIIFLVLYKAIMTYLTRDKKVVTKVTSKVTTTTKTKPRGKIIVKNTRRRLPANVKEMPVPVMVKATPTYAPTVRTSKELQAYDSLLTIQDYKLLLDILKERKEQERLAALRKEKQEKELQKFRELQDLYGVRG